MDIRDDVLLSTPLRFDYESARKAVDEKIREMHTIGPSAAWVVYIESFRPVYVQLKKVADRIGQRKGLTSDFGANFPVLGKVHGPVGVMRELGQMR
jgi:hypothetical protein